MANEFQPDLVEYGDMPGLGMWEDGHYRQHLNYAQVLVAKNRIVTVYPILNLVYDNQQQLFDWLNLHEMMHAGLRSLIGLAGSDLSLLDPKSPGSWDNWQQYHRFEHYAFDQAFGTGVI